MVFHDFSQDEEIGNLTVRNHTWLMCLHNPMCGLVIGVRVIAGEKQMETRLQVEGYATPIWPQMHHLIGYDPGLARLTLTW